MTKSRLSETELLKRELKISRERLNAVFAHVKDCILEYDCKLKTLTLLAGDILGFTAGYTLDDAPNKLASGGFVHPDSHSEIKRLFKRLDDGAEKAECEVKLVREGQDDCWYIMSFTNILDENGEILKAVGVAENITVKKESELRTEQQRDYLQSIIAEAIEVFEVNLTKGVVERNDNASFTLNPDDDVCTQLLSRGNGWILSPYDRDIVESSLSGAELLKAFSEGRTVVKCEYRCLENGKNTWVSTAANLVSEAESGDVYAFIYIVNIDKQKETEHELKKKATLDSLTGFFNRQYGIEKITEKLILRKQGAVSALLMLDIDNFKELNDSFGHAAGDKFLSDIARSIRALIRKDDIVCRLGGDEFFIFMNSINEQLVKSRAKVLCETINATRNDDAKNAKVSVSVGIMFIDSYSLTFREIYEKADKALYEAKRRGKNQYVIYGDITQDVKKESE